MIRAVELALFLAPVAAYLVWRRYLAAGLGAPSRSALLFGLAAVAALGAALGWAGLQERHPESARYVPAQLQDGRVVPGHDR